MFELWITDLIHVCQDKVSEYSMEVGETCYQTTADVFDRYFGLDEERIL